MTHEPPPHPNDHPGDAGTREIARHMAAMIRSCQALNRMDAGQVRDAEAGARAFEAFADLGPP